MSTSDPSFISCLEDVEVRFLYNLPDEEFEQAERLFFQIEQAWWFYEDFYADKYESLPHFKKLKSFADVIFAHCPLLAKIQHKCDELFNEFGNYKSQIPVCGCILLNPTMTRIALICSWKGNTWSFPRGKINEGETPLQCAVRETYEETGFDPKACCREEDCLVVMEDSKAIRMYIAQQVPDNTVFEPQTRKEVSRVEFHDIDNLPKSFSVLPFLDKLRRWINITKRSRRSQSRGGSGAAEHAGRSASNTPPLRDGRKDRRTSPSVRGKGESAAFNERNSDTFTEDISAGTKGWDVHSMFAANAKLTGRQFQYDGNPHAFGSSHPHFVDYRNPLPPVAPITSSSSTTSAVAAKGLPPRPDQRIPRGSQAGTLVENVTNDTQYFPRPFVFDMSDIMGAVNRELAKFGR